MELTLTSALWAVFAFMSVGGAVGMVLGRSPIASLLSLVLTLFSLGVIFLLLEAQFIAAIQIIVYAGAIMVLFLFVIMLLNLGHADYRGDLRGVGWIAAGSAVFGLLAWMIMGMFQTPTMVIDAGTAVLPAEAVAEHGPVGAIAMPMFQDYVVAFEITSLLLLAAIIGAILLAKRRA